MLPLVTVIVPTIGRPLYISDTIKSIQNQSYRNLEILISDNAPNAPTKTFLDSQSLLDTRVKIVTRDRRYPFSEHMNICIHDALGEYFMILSDDDQIGPDYVADAIHLMLSNPLISVCFGRQIKIGESDLGLLDHSRVERKAQIIMDGPRFLSETLSGKFKSGLLTHISLFAQTEMVVELGGFRDYPDGSHADNYLTFCLALNGQIGITSSAMFYRVYLSSFGLKTPFAKLLEATKMYYADCTKVVMSRPNLSLSQKKQILTQLRINNIRLLLSRIRHVYFKKMKFYILFIYIFNIIEFSIIKK